MEISEKLASNVFQVLVKVCGAHEMIRDRFMLWATGPNCERFATPINREFRFGGIFGASVWIPWPGTNIRVSGPNHEELAEAYNSDKLKQALTEANRQLGLLMELEPLVEINGD